jgi:serine/threonine protein kinase
MNLDSLIGQTLDSKYSIERELGRGGMGAVYLATHIGTERPVALKVIVPQFMERAEFVERFKREARAAGRLRHPNVVDVTDFGFANTSQGRVAYLVMEYLDGCTLGEILDEEQQLPLGWTLDIIEQVCSAVHEAHGQGIIHRDLKPDNIWLEPNQRGGYTVKVLDFGIAKLEEPMSGNGEVRQLNRANAVPTQAIDQSGTVADQTNAKTIIENRGGATMIQSGDDEKGTAILSVGNEKGTAILQVSDEKGTAILPAAEILPEDGTAILPGSSRGTQLIEADEGGTKLISRVENTDKSDDASTSELTRVGAVLGTPLYMSPEQCRGERLTAHSDIYSLAVIAYQMLSGKTPFTGNFTEVMDSHKEIAPPPLEAKKVPKNVKKVLFSALAKDKEARPPTAEAFASELRSHSEGFGRLLQKALVIYSEHLPKFLGLAFLLAVPHILLIIIRLVTGTLGATEVISVGSGSFISGVTSFIDFFVRIITAALMVGTVTWLVAHILAFPLKPVSIKAALKAAWEKKRTLFTNVTVSTLIAFLSFGVGGIIGGIASLIVALPLGYFGFGGAAIFVSVTMAVLGVIVVGLFVTSKYMLIAPSIMMEGIKGRAAFRRSSQLIKRSLGTALAISLLIYIVPGLIGFAVGITASTFTRQLALYEKVEKGELRTTTDENGEENFSVSVSPTGVQVKEKDNEKNLTEEEKKARSLSKYRRETISQMLVEVFLAPIMIFITSITSVITALLYFKTRQAGGESMQDLLAKFEDTEHPQSKWQHRIRERLQQSGRISSAERK